MFKKVIFLLVTILYLSCNNKQKLFDTVERINISKKNMYQKQTIELIEDLKITDKEANSQFIFQDINRVFADDNGNIFVVDAGQYSIHVFDSSGNFRYNFGIKGQGPGEFQDIGDSHINSKGLICIYDFINARISLLSKDGVFVSMKKTKWTVYFMHSLDNENFIILKEDFHKGRDKLELVKTKFDSSKDIIYHGNFHKLRTTIINNTEQPFNFGPGSCCECSRQGITVHTTGENYLLEFYNLQGKKFREIYWEDFHPLEVTVNDKQEILKHYSHFPASYVKNIVFSETKHVFKALRFDNRDNLWAIREDKNKKLLADIFNKEGQYLSEVQLPLMLYYISDKYAYSYKLVDNNFYVIRFKIIRK